ncbi:hypothetical protein OsI_07447 [Oryza sativa Indica Group]|uniref:Uncharacterized protein n=1 Tax=Oryza sativa subsp. indica TaxID=39946 RepID=B8AIP8_ORYSI|nr:hypothetical protein OsI_07447 [Oryza sativa Indica Group]
MGGDVEEAGGCSNFRMRPPELNCLRVLEPPLPVDPSPASLATALEPPLTPDPPPARLGHRSYRWAIAERSPDPPLPSPSTTHPHEREAERRQDPRKQQRRLRAGGRFGR